MDLAAVEALVREVADAELLPRFTRVTAHCKPDGSLLTEADTAVQERMVQALEARWPRIPVLGEEMDGARQQQILAGGSYWCLDPLDGTTNFAAGLPYFAVSLALVQGGEVEAGVVYDPQRRECFSARRGAGAWLQGASLRVPAAPAGLSECIALVDIRQLDPVLLGRLVTRASFRSQRSFGAVALDWCWVAGGRCHLYLHGRQNLWDYAAGSLILREAGGVACICDTPAAPCDPALRLGARTGVGAVSEGLFLAWRGLLGAD
jgi:myo-inositol-1(or 4)-monophosphatase